MAFAFQFASANLNALLRSRSQLNGHKDGHARVWIAQCPVKHCRKGPLGHYSPGHIKTGLHIIGAAL